ncbi:MAG: YsnF/AvaK domain-containing protein [Segetibacter sp.]
MAQTVVGMFDNASEAEQAVQKLTRKGFTKDMIDVTSQGISGSSNVDTHREEESGITGFFKSLFSSDDDDDREKYIHVARRSNSIVTVHAQTSDQAEEAADILDDCGAVDVDEKAASYGVTGRSNYDTAGTTMTGADTTDTTIRDTDNDNDYRDVRSRDTSADESTKIPVIEETLEVGKREVLTGGRRLRSRIIEKPVEEVLRLREENVSVERTSVDRPATNEDFDNFKEREIEVTEKAEVPVVTKEARVVEEVRLNKDVTERTETISDTVRKTEVDVEELDKNTNRSERYYRNSSTDSSDRF